VTGELYIGGDGLSREYLNQPKLTEQKFIPNPFQPQSGARLYRTGDYARWLPDGNVEFIGRADFQVKIRGFRVELGEIESVLSSHTCIQNAIVITRLDGSGGKQLVAYLISRKGCEPEEELTKPKLRDFLKKQLPDYMVPAFFVVLESFPLTPNGKVDRKALPAPELSSIGEHFVPPQTPVEKMLVGLWTELLDVEKIGANDNFFDLGGHSLLAMRLFVRIRDVFGLELPLRLLFEAPTVAELAKRIENLVWAAQQNAPAKEAGNADHEEMIL
jgi:acyl carrier protein